MQEYCFGIDVGGTTVKMGLFRTDGELLEKWEIPSHTENEGAAILPDIAKAALGKLEERGIDKKDVAGIGIGVPGPIDANGVVPHTANLGWGYKEVTKELTELTGLPSKGGNDANVAALAEYFYGSMKGYNSGVMITLGTGIGGGIVIDDKLITGSNGVGAEIGHTMVATNYYDCNCGNNGCFETFCSATAIIKYTQKLLKEGRETIIRDMCKNNLENITAKMVFDAYKEGDQVAVEIINRFKKYLAMGIGNIVNFIDPAVISIGGGVSNASDILLDGLSEQVKKHLPFKKAKIGDIVIAKFKNDAGIIGASAL